MLYGCGVRACLEVLGGRWLFGLPAAHLEVITGEPRLSASGQARKLPGNELPHDLRESGGSGPGRTPWFRPKGQVGGAWPSVRAPGPDPAIGMWCGHVAGGTELPGGGTRSAGRPGADGRRTGGGRAGDERKTPGGTRGRRFRADQAVRAAAPGRGGGESAVRRPGGGGMPAGASASPGTRRSSRSRCATVREASPEGVRGASPENGPGSVTGERSGRHRRRGFRGASPETSPGGITGGVRGTSPETGPGNITRDRSGKRHRTVVTVPRTGGGSALRRPSGRAGHALL